MLIGPWQVSRDRLLGRLIRSAQRQHNSKERLRLKYVPRVIDWFLDKSTIHAKTWIQAHGNLGILFDNTIVCHAREWLGVDRKEQLGSA